MTVRPAHLPHVTVSMRVMSAGEGYRYLLRTVAVGDGRRDFATPLTRYYEEKGTPPGFWLGSALPGFGAGELVPRAEVTERQLRRLLGSGLDPITGQALGSAYRTYRTAAERALARIAELPDRLTAAEREQETARIQAEEARRHHAAVAGFDFTFSAPKSVSTLWALLDAGTQALIVDAHHAAIDDILALLEGEVAMTRIGANGVAQVEVRGVAATAYDHYDSRSGDPQLHTHVVVANRVQAVRDGRWRTLDSRALHAAVVALSEHYNATLADRLAVILGLGWEDRTRPRDRTPAWEIVGVPDELIREFSSRSRDIDEEVARLIDEYERDHQRSPTRVQVIRLRQRATLSTRPEKTADSLADLTRKWRDRASTLLKRDATGWAVDILRTRHAQPLLRADDVPLDEVARIAVTVVAAVGERRSTWRRWNLHAEAARQTMGLRFASPEDRAAVIGLVVDEAETRSVELSPPEPASTPPEFRREDGSSAFRPRASTLYSSDDILAAEDHLLALAGTDSAPRVMVEGLDKFLRRPNRNGVILGPDQADAIERLVSSGRVLDVLVGPAGSGKTTTLGALRAVWERRYGRRSVVGLAPSAAAAEVLAGDLGIPTENTAKWLWEHRQGNWNLHRNQLLIIDEASLAGTVALDQLAGHAATVGAKVVLVGDWAQLAAVDASGAFGMLVRARGDAPELIDIRRFRAEWEKEASLSIRVGDADALLSYIDNDRILDGPQSGMLDAAYNAWRDDLSHGKDTILIAHTVELVVQLNERARLDRMAAGQVGASGNRLHDGTEAGVGDRIITRRNDRDLRVGRGWVKNGDRWDVTQRHDDGSLTVRRAGRRLGGRITLPTSYVEEDVELGYAITVHRAQGATVDTAHAIVGGSGMTREVLYVAMTRGRDSNRVYVATDQTELEQHQLPLENPDGLTILSRILERIGAELSAREAIVSEQDEYGSIRRLAAEYETIAQAAQIQRWTQLIENSGMPEWAVDAVLASDALGALIADLRRAEANGHDLDRVLPRIVAERGFGDADDPARILHYRLGRATAGRGSGRGPSRRLIAGLIPEAAGPMPDELRTALAERAHLIQQRARILVIAAASKPTGWIGQLGPAPADEVARERWMLNAEIVAAYRDRYGIVSPTRALGRRAQDHDDPIERLDRQRAAEAVERARRLAGVTVSEPDGTMPAPSQGWTVEL